MDAKGLMSALLQQEDLDLQVLVGDPEKGYRAIKRVQVQALVKGGFNLPDSAKFITITLK